MHDLTSSSVGHQRPTTTLLGSLYIHRQFDEKLNPDLLNLVHF